MACTSANTNVVAPDDSKCGVSLASNTAEVPAAGGEGNVMISTPRDCVWSASADVSWIALTAQTGQGPATVSYVLPANPAGTPRRGRVLVSEQSVEVAQAAAPCRYELSPADVSVDWSAADASIRLTTLEGCRWVARSGAEWIGGPTPSDGTGSATIRFAVAANAGEARSATVTVGDARVRVSQSAAAAAPPPPSPPPPSPAPPPSPPPPPPPLLCSYRLDPSSRNVGRGPEEFTVAVAAPSHCAWTVSSNESWMTVAGGRQGTGNGSFRLAVAGNAGDARSGTVSVGTESLTVRQAAGACDYAIRPSYYNAGRGPDEIDVAVTAAARCEWTAATEASWVTVESGRSGAGDGTVRLRIPANSGAAREAVVTIAGHSFTLRQAGGCEYSIKPTWYHAGRNAEEIRVDVSAAAGCTWTASSPVAWAAVIEGQSGSGAGVVRLRLESNAGAARSATLTIAGEPFELRQSGPQ